jgi:DNA-binding NarL/FixJ family response regulator
MTEWVCKICGKKIILNGSKKSVGKVAGHMSAHKRLKNYEAKLKKKIQAVLKLWRKGYSVKQIQKELHMSPNTICSMLKEKLGEKYLKNRWKRRVNKLFSEQKRK